MIANPTPITPSVFDGMWITRLTVFFPTAERPKGLLTADFSPYDGTNLLRTGSVKKAFLDLATKRLTDPALDGMLTALQAELARLSGNASGPVMLTVDAPDPTKPVRATAIFSDKKSHRIPDCYTLAGTDPVFAAVFTSTMAAVAGLAGLEIV